MKVRVAVVAGPDQGRVFEFEQRDRFLVGRAPDAHLWLQNDPYVGRHHLVLEIDPPHALMRDLGSRNGTQVNGRRVDTAQLAHGDQIRAGETTLRFELDPPPVADVGPTRVDLGLGGDDRVPVLCRSCGAEAAVEAPRPRAEDVTWLCERCQARLADGPILPPGYRMVRELGRGAMGCVYLAVHEQLGQLRAVKQILPKAAMSEQHRKLFLREARAQAQLQHARIVLVYDLQEVATGAFCLIMEYVDGQSADKLIAEGRGMDPGWAVAIVAQALEGLDHAHRQGIVHRDVKEANLLVGRAADGGLSVKLSDFGLAKSYEEAGASGFTRTGSVGGTIPYMPVEQIIDFKRVRPTADIYAMGATLYRLLTGAFPHDFSSGADWLLVVLEQPIVPVRTRNPAVTARLAAVVEKALAREPEQRFATAEEMRRALVAAVA